MSENTVDDDSDPAYWLADAIVKERALNRLMAARRADDVKFAKTAHRWALRVVGGCAALDPVAALGLPARLANHCRLFFDLWHGRRGL
ncbi:MAG: hypothetical protein WDN46_23795 [Methylocella sp.]